MTSINFLKCPNELEECKAYWKWACTVPILKKYLVHHCNEGKRTVSYAAKLLSIGMRPGIPDYQLPIPNGKYNGLWLEMKKRDEKNRKKRKNQLEWIDGLNKAGHYAKFVYGWDEAMEETKQYIKHIDVNILL